MKAVILAAGRGTRLAPLTENRPKSMIALAGRPVLEHEVQQLASVGITDLVIVVGHGADTIQTHLGDGGHFGVSIEYVQQNHQLGPGHALAAAGSAIDEEFLLLPADTWCDAPVLSDLLAADGCASVQLADSDEDRHGRPVLKRGKILDLSLDADIAPLAGAHRLDGRIFHALASNDNRLRDALRSLMQETPFSLVQTTPLTCIDLTSPEALLRLHAILMERIDGTQLGQVQSSSTLEGTVHIGKESVIHPGAVIRGPAFIGDNCDIGPGAVIESGTAVGDNSRIEPFTLVKRSAIGENVTIRSHGRIQDALLDDGANLGAHVMIGQFAMVGQDAEIRSRAMVTHGGRIGSHARVAEGRVVDHVPPGGVAV